MYVKEMCKRRGNQAIPLSLYMIFLTSPGREGGRLELRSRVMKKGQAGLNTRTNTPEDIQSAV